MTFRRPTSISPKMENPEKAPKPSLAKEFLHLIWAGGWKWLGQEQVGEAVRDAADSVKQKAKILFAFVLVLAFGLTSGVFLTGCWYSSSVSDLNDQLNTVRQKIDDLNREKDDGRNRENDLKRQIDVLGGQKSVEISDLNRKLDKAEKRAVDAEQDLAQWITLARSHVTNSPLTDSIDRLFVEFTNVVVAGPSFSIDLNRAGTSTNGFPETIEIIIRNTGTKAARPTIHLSSDIPKTNFIAAGWNWTGYTQVGNEKFGVLSVQADLPCPPGGNFLCPPIILTGHPISRPREVSIRCFSEFSKEAKLSLFIP